MNKPNKTEITKKTYQRISAFYNFMEIIPEMFYKKWRRQFWSVIDGHTILEVGVGTGKNLPYYRDNQKYDAIDLTPGMLRQATTKAEKSGNEVNLLLGDVQNLEFPDNSYDTAVATFVFCSVPDPIKGLREIKRVVKPGGKIYLMEHVRAKQAFIGKIMDWLNPLVVRIMGPNINRDTVTNVKNSGLDILEIKDLGIGGIYIIIVAQVNDANPD